MITFTARSRSHIVGLHTSIADALERRDARQVDALLADLADYTSQLGQSVAAAKKNASKGN